MTRHLIPFLFLLLILGSCKELNDGYPYQSWGVLFYKTEELKPREISAILYENDHSVWLGSSGSEGIVHYDGKKWSEINAHTSGFLFCHVNAIMRDGTGKLWAAWNGGLAFVHDDTWTKIQEFDGLNVTSLAIKGLAGIWAGIDGTEETGGIAFDTGNGWSVMNKKNSNIPSSRVTCLAFDHRQVLWIGTADKGIIAYDGDAFLSYPLTPGPGGEITCMTTDAEGVPWAGTSASQLACVRDWQMEVLSTGTASPVNAIAADQYGTILMATSGSGLISFRDNKWSAFTRSQNRLPSDTVTALFARPDGYLLFSYPSGEVVQMKIEGH